MSEFHEQAVLPTQITAQQSRRAPLMFNIMNIIAVMVPLPLMVFWLGASMVLYAMNRHHPNPKVAHYVQAASTRLYGVAGAAVPVGTFFSLDATPWLIYWGLSALIMIPLSVRDIVRIRADEWKDTDLQGVNYD